MHIRGERYIDAYMERELYRNTDIVGYIQLVVYLYAHLYLYTKKCSRIKNMHTITQAILHAYTYLS